MRQFYVRWILYPLILWQVKHMPLYLDFIYLYIQRLQHEAQGVLMKPDYIAQVRAALNK